MYFTDLLGTYCVLSEISQSRDSIYLIFKDFPSSSSETFVNKYHLLTPYECMYGQKPLTPCMTLKHYLHSQTDVMNFNSFHKPLAKT